jgi:hypothetical protein
MLGFAEGRQPAPRSSPVDAPIGGEEVRNQQQATVTMSDSGKEDDGGKLARAWRHLTCGFRCYFARIFGKR